MKLFFLLLSLPFVCVSCSWVSSPRINKAIIEHTGDGETNVSGAAIGEWTIYEDVNESVFAKGAFVAGKPEGVWEIWDDHGMKNAELNFTNGNYNNQYLLFYTSYTPEAEGMLKTIGNTAEGRFSGQFSRYSPDGTIYVKYTAQNGQVTAVEAGSSLDATEQLAADQFLLNLYREAILNAPQQY